MEVTPQPAEHTDSMFEDQEELVAVIVGEENEVEQR